MVLSRKAAQVRAVSQLHLCYIVESPALFSGGFLRPYGDGHHRHVLPRPRISPSTPPFQVPQRMSQPLLRGRSAGGCTRPPRSNESRCRRGDAGPARSRRGGRSRAPQKEEERNHAARPRSLTSSRRQRMTAAGDGDGTAAAAAAVPRWQRSYIRRSHRCRRKIDLAATSFSASAG